MKKRLDVLLVEKGLASSREKAKAIIMSGIVFVDGQREDKAGSTFDETKEIVLKGKTLKYVSRGGLKLEKAMKNFDISLDGKICMDVGASTGGFTDCMLQNGAVKVYSVDVGHGQLDWKLRNDDRVVCMERTNMRYVTEEDIDEPAQFVSIDVSFISLTKILPAVYRVLEDGGQTVALIKPQFEAGREKVGKKGVVRDQKVHEEVIEKICSLPEEIRKNSRFHFIGHLQTNKAEKVVKYFDYIQSVDSLKLAKVISEAAGRLNKIQKVLLEINISEEVQKFGFSKRELYDNFEEILNLENLAVNGFMCMAPLGASDDELDRVFNEALQIKTELNKKYNLNLQELSMGMSDDYLRAVANGATMIRLGRILFK